MNEGRIVEVCTSVRKGQQKAVVHEATLLRGHGIQGDAHAGDWHRQVSLLAEEHVDRMRAAGLDLFPGAFAENILTRGFDLDTLPLGARFRIGSDVVLQVTQRGKECHTRCAIYTKAGHCIMPTRGVFTRVVRGGSLKRDDPIRCDPAFERVRYAVITMSDKGVRGEREDTSGPLVCDLLGRTLDGLPLERKILADDAEALQGEMIRLADREVCDLIVTTGGTGLSPRDVTPEATRSVLTREIPGMAEAMRAAGLTHTPHAMLSRGLCGQRGQTIIINLSGSRKAVQEQLEVILPVLPHAIQTASGLPVDCART